MNDRLKPIEAAERFINSHFPACSAALLAGSVVRGQANPASDLDIVVFDGTQETSYRESLVAYGWPIEVFVHNLASYRFFFESDKKAAKPSMPRMVQEGIPLKDSGVLAAIKKEAAALLAQGLDEWTPATLRLKRYFMTDVLDDFAGSENRAERLFCANALAELTSEFILRTNRKWTGTSKWLIRSLAEHDPEMAAEFTEAFDRFYRHDETAPVIAFVERILEPFGGRLFEGFSIGKTERT